MILGELKKTEIITARNIDNVQRLRYHKAQKQNLQKNFEWKFCSFLSYQCNALCTVYTIFIFIAGAYISDEFFNKALLTSNAHIWR